MAFELTAVATVAYALGHLVLTVMPDLEQLQTWELVSSALSL
jgi:hypothetical protein